MFSWGNILVPEAQSSIGINLVIKHHEKQAKTKCGYIIKGVVTARSLAGAD